MLMIPCEMNLSGVFISSILFIHRFSEHSGEKKKKQQVLKSRVVYVKRSKCFPYFLQRPRALLSQGLNFFSERVNPLKHQPSFLLGHSSISWI